MVRGALQDDDRRFMARALELAARAAGETNPNPLVGCVITRGGRVVGEGFHARAGGPHAEVHALREAGALARGASLYVTLEPCTVHGRTPPCAPVVRQAGVRRVVVATRDPNPKVQGRGLQLLRRAGIEVVCGVLAAEAERQNERFLTAMRLGRPFVLLKAATTLDGRIATARGESKWITSAAQRREARRLRRLHDAVVIGAGTALADDPMLLPSPLVRRPFYRVVLDADLALPLGSRLVRSAASSPVLVFCSRCEGRRKERLEQKGVRVYCGPARERGVPLAWVLRTLWSEGILSVMVEGGSEVLGEFLRLRLVDKVTLFRAPLLLGGRGSLPAFGGPDPERLSQALRLTRGRTSELLEEWYPVRKAGGRHTMGRRQE